MQRLATYFSGLAILGLLVACSAPGGAKAGPTTDNTAGASGAAIGSSGTTGASGAAGVGGTPAAGGTTGASGTTGVGGTVGGSDTAGAAGTAGASGAAGTDSTAPTLNQAGNPVYGFLTGYRSWLSTAASAAAKLTADRTLADNMITWQLPHGGFYKNGVAVYAAPWNGTAARSGWLGANGVELGTIDNSATVTELMFLADVYQRSGDTKYRDAARRALDFLLTMQYPSGGFPQVYPERPDTYSNYVTFNDDAMARTMILLDQASKLTAPLDVDLFTSDEQSKLPGAIAKGVEYILAAQIVQAGVKTVWCAQHDATTYAPLGARSYELPSKSGSESVGVIALLMTQPQTPAIQASVQAAIAWYRMSGVPNTAFVSRPAGSTDDTYDPIQAKAGATMWYRFYDLDQDTGFFSGRLPTDNPPGVGKKYDIMQIEPERRYGYQWAGAYGTRLFAYTDSVGY